MNFKFYACKLLVIGMVPGHAHVFPGCTSLFNLHDEVS